MCGEILLLIKDKLYLSSKYLVNLGVWGKPMIIKTFPGQRFSRSPGGRRWLHTAAICTILHSTAQYYTSLHIIAWPCLSLHTTTQYCMIEVNTAHNCISLHITADNCTSLHITAQHISVYSYIVIYSTKLQQAAFKHFSAVRTQTRGAASLSRDIRGPLYWTSAVWYCYT